MTTDDQQRRDGRLAIRMSSGERAALLFLAAEDGSNASQVVRRLVRQEARQHGVIVGDQFKTIREKR